MGWKHRIKGISLAFLVELYSTAIHVPTVSIISTLLFACVDLPFPLFLSTLVDTVMRFVVLYRTGTGGAHVQNVKFCPRKIT